MRIAFIDFVLDPAQPGTSGLSDVVWDTARALARLGNTIHIIGPYSSTPPIEDNITVHKMELPPINYRNIIGHMLIAIKACRTVRAIKGIDIIVAPEYVSTAVASLNRSIPTVLITPGNIYERLASENPFDPMTTQVYKVAAKISARRCAKIIAISDDMAYWWGRSGAKREDIVVIPHGIDLGLFKPGNVASIGDSDGDTLRLLYVGRLSVEKGVGVLLDTVVQLAEDGIRVRLDVIGDGPLREQLERRVHASELGSDISFHGWHPKEELPAYYAAADVLVVPSLSEPLGRVVLEGMGCGVPVVASRVGGIPEHVHPGENGWLVDPGDISGFVSTLGYVAQNRQELSALGRNAARYVHTSLGWNMVGQRIEEVLLQAKNVAT